MSFLPQVRRIVTAAAVICSFTLLSFTASSASAKDKNADQPQFMVGFAETDITPPVGMPMWGYGARRDALSTGVLDPLYAKALVFTVGKDKAAIVGTDIGRGPTIEMMKEIRQQLKEKAGIEHVIISGSHSHHGPVIELTDRPGFGGGKFDVAVKYAQDLPQMLVDVILKADEASQPAKLGVAKKNFDLNRNRHTKRQPRSTDPMLAVLRFDTLQGEPIAVLVNFAAHPVMTDADDLRYSADYVGFMHKKINEELGIPSVFMQGAAGDLSPNPQQDAPGPAGFGAVLGGHAAELAKGIETVVPEKPSIKGTHHEMLFGSRIDFTNPWIKVAYGRAFFPELIQNFAEENTYGIPTEMNLILLNDQIAMVSGSGEFFCNHSNRWKERAYVEHPLFFGYANGHSLYFPTIEATSEGGYGADPTVSPVELGAGETMLNQALIDLYTLQGKYQGEPRVEARPQEAAEAAAQK